MFGKEEVKKIENHIKAYSSANLEIPSYRITDIEHMVLENYMQWCFPESCKGSIGPIKSFMGVTLEIVKKEGY